MAPVVEMDRRMTDVVAREKKTRWIVALGWAIRSTVVHPGA